MKRFFLMIAMGIPLAWVACGAADARYVDLNTGNTVKLEKNDAGLMVNAETKKPVHIYVDTKTNDTIYGKTGDIINGHIVKTGENSYGYDADIQADGDYKMKVEGDGDIKIKDGDTKTKIDGETGEKKVKKD